MTKRMQKQTVPTKPSGTGLTEHAVRTLSAAKDEPHWVTERRLQAWRLYEQMPMPSPRDEEWRRTSLNSVPLNTIVPFSSARPVATEEESLPPELRTHIDGGVEKAALVIQQDSYGIYTFLADNLAKRGVIIGHLDKTIVEYPELFHDYFMTNAIPAEDSKFAALHGALWSGGTLIYVPPNVEVSLPVHSIVYMSQPELGIFPHTLIVAERGSSVTVVNEYLSLPQEGKSLSVPMIEVFAKDGAQVRCVNVQEWHDDVYTLANHRVIIGSDAYVQYCNIGLGGRLSKVHTVSRIQGPGTRSDILGLMFGQRRQHYDHFTAQDHQAPHTTSTMLFKSVLKDQARYVYYGLIKMQKAAQQSEGFQTDRNLLLTGRAKADSIPILEIEADDVKCSHASATGPMDEEQLFYLMSRGLSRLEAEHLMVQGFFEPVLSQIPLPWMRDKLSGLIQQQLGEV